MASTAKTPAKRAPAKARGVKPVVVTDENVSDVPDDMPPGPVEGSVGAEMEAGAQRRLATGDPSGGLGVLRTAVEKDHPQEGKIGVVDRELTELGQRVGIAHGVVSHTLNNEGVEPTGLPYMRCPNCGNVNIALHNLARTSAHCPACGWHTGSLSGEGNPPGKIPGLHEVDGGLAAAGEIPRGKLEGALGMDPVEAKEGVFVKDVDRPVTVTHVGADGERIGQSNVSLPDPGDPALEEGSQVDLSPPVEPSDSIEDASLGERRLAENARGGDITSTKNRR